MNKQANKWTKTVPVFFLVQFSVKGLLEYHRKHVEDNYLRTIQKAVKCCGHLHTSGQLRRKVGEHLLLWFLFHFKRSKMVVVLNQRYKGHIFLCYCDVLIASVFWSISQSLKQSKSLATLKNLLRISFIYNGDLAKKAHKQQYVTSLTDIQSLLYITGMLPNISPGINQLYKIPQTSNKTIKEGRS